MSVAQDDTFNLQNGFLSLPYVCLCACYNLTSIAKNAFLVSWMPFKIAYFMINPKTIRLNQDIAVPLDKYTHLPYLTPVVPL